MRILSATVENFGSYERLEFDFTDQGLTLISGPTGAGKSTLCDVIPWTVFGVTSKNGAADEVRQWGTKAPTKAIVEVEPADRCNIVIVRERGPKNDLYYYKGDGEPIRGKDLNDTQKLINAKLGLTAETFLAGAYFHEFSQTAAFFTTTAKTRRQITEQLADLSQAKKLTETMSEYRKELKTEVEDKNTQLATVKTKTQMLNKSVYLEEQRCIDWYDSRNSRVSALELTHRDFETERENTIANIEVEHIERSASFQVDIIDTEKSIVSDEVFQDKHTVLQDRHDALLKDGKCKECGAPKNVDQLMVIKKDLYKLEIDQKANEDRKRQLKTLCQRLETHMKTLEPKLAVESSRKNTYVEQITALKKEVNPHEDYKQSLYEELRTLNKQYDALETSIEDLSLELSDIDLLIKVTQDLRAVLLNNAVSYLEIETNKLLTDHFDAEIKVSFSVEDADKLDVTIHKDGNICSYSQLSKGQRQILRLTFACAVMKCVANNSGVKSSVVFMDEFSDGLDEEMKIKAFGLVESFSMDYDTVIAIDHNEAVKSMFTNRYDVQLVNGKSVISG